jgi:amidohydrolase
MIKDGATNGLTHILGVHVYPDLSVGTVGIKEGSFTAAAGEIKVEIKGKSGHGARPHEGIDAIWVASKVISGIQELITRQLDPLDPVVITFGKINGGSAFNVLAEKVNLVGTVRCTNLKLFRNIGNWLSENISSIASSCGAEAKVIFREITPPVNNNFQITRIFRESAIKVLGQENVIELQKPSLGAEDFAEFLNDIPGAMFRLGVSGSMGCAPLHSSKFNPDESAIAVGIKVITESIVKLNNEIINAADK